MAKHMVKCLYCGQMFDANAEPFVRPNARRYAHKDCAQNIENVKTQEEKDREELEEYIKELFNVTTISTRVRKQIDAFKKENNYTYSGMRKTLKYFFDIRGNDIEKAHGGIGIIPYTYDEACTYWRGIWEIQQANKRVEIKEYNLPTREIHIVPPKREPMKHKRQLFTFLNEREGDT